MVGMSQEYRKRELKAFDDTKAGVKGLADSAISKIPDIFSNAQTLKIKNSESEYSNDSIPVIDLHGILLGDTKFRPAIVDQIRDACENWGFFQIINHGICCSTLDGILEGVRKFHEQETEVKKEFYCRGPGKKVMYYSNYALFTAPVADWRDSLACFIAPNPPEPEELPQICRNEYFEFSKEVMKLGSSLLELISTALGLDPNHLNNIGCGEGALFLGHYYPKCPQPELTFGSSKHTDTDFVTIVLQDRVGGLQVLYQDKWVDVPPLKGALVVNLGDLMQLITNDKFKSVNHQVLATDTSARVSLACFLSPNRGSRNASRLYGPIKELLSEEEAPIYRDLTIQEIDAHYVSKGPNGVRAIEYFKL